MTGRWFHLVTVIPLLAGLAPAWASLTLEPLETPPEGWTPAAPPRIAVTVDGRWSVNAPSPEAEISLWQEPGNSGLVRADHAGAQPGRPVGPSAPSSPPAALRRFADGSAVTVFTGPAGTMVAYTYRPKEEVWSAVTTWPGDLTPHADFPPGLFRRDAAVVLLAITTDAAGAPLLQATTSNTAGRRWSNAVRISTVDTTPAGEPAAVILPNGHVWIAWRTVNGEIVLRLLHGGGQVGEIQRLGPAAGAPQLWLEPAPPDVLPRFVLTFTGPDDSVQHHRVIPPAPRFTWTRDCGCDPTTGVIRGHPLRGEILHRLEEPPGFAIRHDEIPGIMPAGTRSVRLDPRLLDVLEIGQPFLARIERRDDGHCWIFDIRLLQPVRR